MAPDDEDAEDLYDDEFDFVDDDDDSEVDASDTEDSETEASDLDDSEFDRADPVPDSELDDEPAPRPTVANRSSRGADDDEITDGPQRDGERAAEDREPDDDFGPPAPPTNYRVHVYEYQQFKRTIDRPFTAEDAEAFASEYNRTSKSYARFAVAGKEDAKPRKTLD
jgi:hypothetical protein